MKNFLQKLLLPCLIFTYTSFAGDLNDASAEKMFREIVSKQYEILQTEKDKKYLFGLTLNYVKAKNGDAKAQLFLGKIFYNNNYIFINQNFNQAFYWFKKAADNGEVEAYGFLGAMYNLGIGCEKNLEKGFKLAKLAADKNDPSACYNVASYYLEGEGTAINKKKAFEYCNKGVQLGNVNLYTELGLMYLYGRGTPINKAKAFNCFKKASEKDIPAGYRLLGQCYLNGDGVEKNTQVGLGFVNIAADKGDKLAYIFLGYRYFQGDGVLQDLNKAEEWLSHPTVINDPRAVELIDKIKALRNK